MPYSLDTSDIDRAVCWLTQISHKKTDPARLVKSYLLLLLKTTSIWAHPRANLWESEVYH